MELPSVQGIDEILEEARAMEEALAFRTRGPGGEAVPLQGDTHLLSAVHPVAARCDPRNLNRLIPVCRMEEDYPEYDHTAHVLLGCTVVEQELVRLIAEPARRLGPTLLLALEGRTKRSQKEILEKWLDRRIPTTLGTLEMILYALRRGRELVLPEFETFLATWFRPGYGDLLATNGLCQSVAQVRQEYRNPAAHGEREVPRSEYGRFCELVLGSPSFRQWLKEGPQPEPPAPDRGLLHHHLAHARLEPGELLQRLRTPVESPFHVSLEVMRATASVGIRGPAATSFRVGDSVRFVLKSPGPCWVLLLTLSSQGGTVLFPNRFRPDLHFKGGILCVPNFPDPECEFPLEGPHGTETVLAVVTREPLPLPHLTEGPDAGLRTLTADDLDRLAETLPGLAPANWGGRRVQV